MSTNQKKRFLISQTAMMTLIIGFQNCARTEFTGEQASAASAVATVTAPINTSRTVKVPGCATGFVCGVYQNNYLEDGTRKPLSTIPAGCLQAQGNQVSVYSWAAYYKQIWVTLPYSQEIETFARCTAISEAELRDSSECSHTISVPD